MKKLFVIFAAVALVCAFSLQAAAVDWNFYGSARMATYYTNDSNPRGRGGSDDSLQWDLQGNSRIGVRVKQEGSVTGRIELGINDSVPGGGTVTSRLVYGTWDFGAGKLKVGKDYTPVSQFISGQVYDGDLGLLGIGTYYGFRQGQISLSFGGFEIAAITQTDQNIEDVDGTSTDARNIESYIPKFEAKWGMAMDTFNFNIMGGFQYYTLGAVKSIDRGNNKRDDIDVTSWVVGADLGFNFGPAYIKGAVSYDQNGEEAGWYHYTSSPAFWDGKNSIKDVNMLQAAIVAGFKMSDMVTLEAGYGWSDVSSDLKDSDDYNPWSAYAQAVIGMAPGVWLIPEVGIFDFDKLASNGQSAGQVWYAGAKWQIDF